MKPGVNLWSRVLIYNRPTRDRERERERDRETETERQRERERIRAKHSVLSRVKSVFRKH